MHPKERQKMCKNCDGRIPVETQLCPYCASEQSLFHSVSPGGSGGPQHQRSLQESLTSLYTPASSKGKVPPGLEKPLYPPKDPLQEKRPAAAQASVTEAQEEGRSSPFWPILMLSLGANLLIVGLLQLFFSDHGILRLEWNSAHWFVYCLAAVPLFFFGLRKA